MTSWDIDPGGVRSVLLNTEAVAQEFDGQMKTLNSGIEGAATQSSSDIVASALVGYAESASADITFVFTRTGACLSGAGPSIVVFSKAPHDRAAALLGAIYEDLGLTYTIRQLAAHPPGSPS